MVRKCLNSQSIRFIPIFSHQMKAQTRKKFDAYQSTVASVANVKDDPARPLFSGFKAGKAFFTKLGNRGLALDTLWIRHLIQSFILDDAEMAEVALSSSLADLTLRVEGGECGSPYSIGEFGFYSREQFESQASLLSSHEREASAGNYFLSIGEWQVVDNYFSRLAHHSNSVFEKAACGDTLGSLAVMRSAFLVTKLCLQKGLDPLLENIDQRDLIQQIKTQYLDLTKELKRIFAEESKYYREIKPRTEIENMRNWQHQNHQSFAHLITLLHYLLEENFPQRLIQIDQDLSLKRRCELLHQPFPVEKTWNITQQAKVQGHMEGCQELLQYVQEKVAQTAKNMADFAEQVTKFQEDTKTRQEALLKGLAIKKNANKLRQSMEVALVPSDAAQHDTTEEEDANTKSPHNNHKHHHKHHHNHHDHHQEGSSKEQAVSSSSSSSLSSSQKRSTLVGLLVVNTSDTQVYYK